MAIVSPLRRTVRRPAPQVQVEVERTRTGVGSWYAALQDALARPLTSYYLLLGACALRLPIALIMVFSASSVYAFENYDHNSYAVVVKQLTWVAIGLPCAW